MYDNIIKIPKKCTKTWSLWQFQTQNEGIPRLGSCWDHWLQPSTASSSLEAVVMVAVFLMHVSIPPISTLLPLFKGSMFGKFGGLISWITFKNFKKHLKWPNQWNHRVFSASFPGFVQIFGHSICYGAEIPSCQLVHGSPPLDIGPAKENGAVAWMSK